MIEILTVILLAVWNGLVIRWYLTKDQKYSKYWHIVGYLIRVIPLYYIYPNIICMLIYSNIAWTVYDMIINKLNGWDWFYVGNTSWFDRTFGKFILLGKAMFLVGTIVYLVIFN